MDEFNFFYITDDLERFLEEPGYKGQDFYVSAQAAVDKGFITANETAAVEFAHAIFKQLNMEESEKFDGWYDYFKNGMVR